MRRFFCRSPDPTPITLLVERTQTPTALACASHKHKRTRCRSRPFSDHTRSTACLTQTQTPITPAILRPTAGGIKR